MSDEPTQRILDAIAALHVDAMSRMDDAFRRTDGAIGRIGDAIAGLRGDIGRIDDSIAGLRDDIGRIDGAIGRIDNTIGVLRGDVMGRIDRLQDTVDRAREDIVVNFGHAERVEKSARNAVDDVRIQADMLRVMQRQISRLQTDIEQLKGPP